MKVDLHCYEALSTRFFALRQRLPFLCWLQTQQNLVEYMGKFSALPILEYVYKGLEYLLISLFATNGFCLSFVESA